MVAQKSIQLRLSVLTLVPIQKTAVENAVISHAPVPPTAQRTAELQGEECEVLD